jgi:hypothetical protein
MTQLYRPQNVLSPKNTEIDWIVLIDSIIPRILRLRQVWEARNYSWENYARAG